MKTEKMFFILALALLFCMMLTCASAAVSPRQEQTEISIINTTDTKSETVMPEEKSEHKTGLLPETERKFRLPAMLQMIEDDVFEGTHIALPDHRTEAESAENAGGTLSVSSLPALLRRIEEQAFEGTAVVVVELPETVESIGDRAFAGNPHLRIIRIPEKTEYIAHNAFAGSQQVMISGASGSYARTWAGKHGIPFSPMTMITAGNQNLSGMLTLSGSDIETIETASGEGMDNPPARRNDEIKAEVYEQQIAHQVQGRSPPFCA